ncbi:MAG TPA: helix-turn-helix domain-containing protein [Acidimicrobiales bacterium]|nr:helix-turn-helix domain-containing protein [Acidimicrobiales bacterium]
MGERYLTQTEAARRAGVSKDSIIRARRAGRLAGARLAEGRWLIPAEALVAAGLAPSDESETLSRQGEPDVEDTGEACDVELARSGARIAALEDVVARQDEELRFLRQLLADAVAARRQP